MKLCDTCIYRNNVEQLKPCIIYRDNCEYYERGDVFIADQCECENCIHEEMCKWKEERHGQECAYMQEPKTGHWIMSVDGLYRPICDKCGAHPWKGYIPTAEEATEVFKYCPNCGAKMIEPQEREGKYDNRM